MGPLLRLSIEAELRWKGELWHGMRRSSHPPRVRLPLGFLRYPGQAHRLQVLPLGEKRDWPARLRSFNGYHL